MNDVIIEEQLHRIRNDLEARGLTYDRLQDDILDHLCCMIEEKLEEGLDFDSSYGEIMSGIEGDSFFESSTSDLIDFGP